jgi:hypothetical protein
MSRGSSRRSSSATPPRAVSSSTTSPRAGSSLTTPPTPHVRLLRPVAWLVTRLVVDYFTYTARPIASARRAARQAARRRLLRLQRASGCLDTLCSSSCGSSCRSSSTTSPTPCVRVPRHVARLITRLVVDYFASRRLVVDYFSYVVHPGASARRVTRRRPHVVSPLDFSSVGRNGSCRAHDRSFSRDDYSVPPLNLLSGHTGSTSAKLCITTTCLVATVALLRVRCALPWRRLPIASHRPFTSTRFPN